MIVSPWKIVIGVLLVSLTVLILVIAYRKLLAYLGKGQPSPENYCVLYSLEENPASGELEFYFTSPEKKMVRLELLDAQMSLMEMISEKECNVGGNIIRFDSSKFENGLYYYCLKTDNQKTMKKVTLKN